ncbi:GNAT family N-acetyltransferase [Parendozoicomonas haliclonae]|uniref:Ribosomal-protein-L7/L12-serine acetyltransferase n=1 Tax=Parendozoicomonas haliclonae TaxID=1960125 RepID=A0A1X7AK47_9GAMM|nr:GNAT family protein [Parendozoicomonas haliclonae]SMA46998.1 ribosomal-protein-L7/L12-serine acetyltransferase [Parendozoicomonas haliclonae]
MIELRDFIHDDAQTLQRLANNPKVSRYLVDIFPYPYTDTDAEWWITTGSKQGITKVILHNGEFVGSVAAVRRTHEQRHMASVGYWLGEPFWGQGIAATALQQLTEEVFATTDIQKLSAGVFSPNTASMRVLEKAGYHREAILKKAILKPEGLLDEHIFVRFRDM